MEAIDKKQLESIKRFGRRLGGDAGRLRMAVCVLIAGAGIFGVERPLGLRLAAARTANVKAKQASQMAEEVAFFTKERAGYEPRMQVPGDITDWQNYVLATLRCTRATLISLEPRKPVAKGVFSVLEMELVAKGDSYLEFADFVDRLERGPRIVRIEKLRMEKQQASIYVTCIIRGLVKGSSKTTAAGGKAALDPKLFIGPLPPGAEPAPSVDAAPPADDASGDEASSDDSEAETAAETDAEDEDA